MSGVWLENSPFLKFGFINKRFISHSSRAWEVQDQGTSRSSVWWGLIGNLHFWEVLRWVSGYWSGDCILEPPAVGQCTWKIPKDRVVMICGSFIWEAGADSRWLVVCWTLCQGQERVFWKHLTLWAKHTPFWMTPSLSVKQRFRLVLTLPLFKIL